MGVGEKYESDCILSSSRIYGKWRKRIGRRHDRVYCKVDKGGRKCAVGRETDASENNKGRCIREKMVTDYSDVKLETKDLILKKAEFEDWKTIYYNLWRHKESAKYMLWQPTETDEDAKDRMKRTIAFEEKPENKYALFVYLKKTGEAIGFAGMRELERGIYEETGIALGPEFVRKGYGRQILTALLEEAGKLGAKEFHACNRTGNAASRELQLSCGFVFDSLSEEKTDSRTGETYILENHIYRY